MSSDARSIGNVGAVEDARLKERVLYSLVFCVIGIAVNVIGAQLALMLDLPLFLDCIGTVLVAIVGGYIPGIIVGYATNLINGMGDTVTFYYGVINVMIAVIAAWLASHGWLKKPVGVIGAIVAFSLIGGGIGSVLTWFLYGMGFGSGISADLAHQFYDAGGFSVFTAQLLADMVIDLPDKAIVVLIALGIAHFIPPNAKDELNFKLWLQTPLTDAEIEDVKRVRPRIASVRTKIAVLVSVVMVIVAVVTVGISYLTYHRANVESQGEAGLGITQLAARSVDADMVEAYLEQGTAAPGYAETERELVSIRDSFPDVQYVYVYKILEDGCHVVFDPDADGLPGEEPGTVIPFDEAFLPYLDDLLNGKPIDPIVSDETYGWLLTAYQPIYDSTGECAAYVAVDISMDDLVGAETGYMARVISLFAAFFVLICTVGLWLAEYALNLPINSIAEASGNFAFGVTSRREDAIEHLRRLNVHTGDEIENLYQAVLKTSEDTVQFIADVEEKSATIDRMQSNLIMVMADLVESRDKFTGDHIRKTAAYVEMMLYEMRDAGVYPDEMTDEFISNTIRSAPLHDIGKIVVSDTILNKPGRLTDEEFEVMKSHTTAGREILRQATGAVSESSYLDEAQNLAAYHHEKWNGQGYPCGLAGEDIPLSARIMAVADVFDALVSKRSYKDGFPIEKALDIIREGVGTHFDPVIAEVFLNAEDKVRAIAASHGDTEGTGADPREQA